MFANKKLLVLTLVLLVNALSYGIIIPLLYPYATRFGINPIGLSFLFASFSLAQFIATPILGRLSDKYGRKPVLLLCLLGSSLSLALFASAQSALVLFIARIIDGATGGNNSVAQAMIADETTGKDRAAGFGLLGAAFGFGFFVGPALGGLLSKISLTAPFWFAAALALSGAIAGQLILTETLKDKGTQKQHKPIFNFTNMIHALLSPTTGVVLALTLITAIGLNTFVLGFQTFTVDVLKMNALQIGLLYSTFGLISIIMQAGGIPLLVRKVASKKKLLLVSLTLSMIGLLLISITRSPYPFIAMMTFFAVVSAPLMPVIGALLSERTKAEDQGGMLGINQSYLSLGQIIGPLLAGYVALYSVPGVFVVAAALYALAVVIGKWLFVPVTHKIDL
jgi:MFS family permease